MLSGLTPKLFRDYAMEKRGQTQEVFVWLFVLVVAASILFFGIKLIKKSEGLKDDVLAVKFFNDLDKKLKQYYFLDKGSSGQENFLLPGDVEEVCFINPKDLDDEDLDDVEENKYFYQLKDFSNVFIMPNTLYQENRYNLTTIFAIDNNPECFGLANGVLTINLINEGVQKGVNITKK